MFRTLKYIIRDACRRWTCVGCGYTNQDWFVTRHVLKAIREAYPEPPTCNASVRRGSPAYQNWLTRNG